MEYDCSSHPMYEDYHLRASRLFEREHHIASVPFKKYSEDTFYSEFADYSMMVLEVLGDMQLLSYEELGGLSDLGPCDT